MPLHMLPPALLRADHRVVYLFHGTGRQNIESIIHSGFLGRHAVSGGRLIWFSRQANYSYGFTMSVPGKGLAAAGSDRGSAAQGRSSVASRTLGPAWTSQKISVASGSPRALSNKSEPRAVRAVVTCGVSSALRAS